MAGGAKKVFSKAAASDQGFDGRVEALRERKRTQQPLKPRGLHMSRHGEKREGTFGEQGVIERPGFIPWRHQRKRKYAPEPQPIIRSMEVNIKSNLNFLGLHESEVKGEIA